MQYQNFLHQAFLLPPFQTNLPSELTLTLIFAKIDILI
jgi:hypothetical protein